MGLSIKTSDDKGFREIVVLLINSLRTNIEIKPVVNDFEKIDSFKNYIISRYIEKLTSITANYIKLDWILNKITFDELKNLITDDNEKINNESQIELIVTILRPLTEIYLEVKSIELCKLKFNMDYETSCHLLFFNSLTESFQLKQSISKDIYNCEPKYFKIWSETNSKVLNKIRQQLSESGIPLLKNVKNKYKSILDYYDTTERIVLGLDYLSHYSVISKKAHFSYTNIQYSNLKPSVYFAWCLLFILLIYKDLMKLNDKTDELFKLIEPIVERFVDKSSNHDFNLYQIDNIIFLEYGVARIKNIKGLTYEIEYVVSNCFKTNEIDFIPKIFVIGKVDANFLETTKRKYYISDKEIYQDEQFELFYSDIYTHSAPKPVDI